jgi:hypothetical protein
VSRDRASFEAKIELERSTRRPERQVRQPHSQSRNHRLQFSLARQELLRSANSSAYWMQKTPPNSPPPRFGHAMAYDTARQEVVLFGGLLASGAGNADTWVWNGTTWAQVFPATSPPSRDLAAMTCDSVRNETILFACSADGLHYSLRTSTTPGCGTGSIGQNDFRQQARRPREATPSPTVPFVIRSSCLAGTITAHSAATIRGHGMEPTGLDSRRPPVLRRVPITRWPMTQLVVRLSSSVEAVFPAQTEVTSTTPGYLRIPHPAVFLGRRTTARAEGGPTSYAQTAPHSRIKEPASATSTPESRSGRPTPFFSGIES